MMLSKKTIGTAQISQIVVSTAITTEIKKLILYNIKIFP